MNKKIIINNKEYELIINYRDAYDEKDFFEKCTDYFYDYDNIIGDIAYGKLRLKGFYDAKNKKAKDLNNFKFKDKYLTENCANDCKYFIVKKIN